MKSPSWRGTATAFVSLTLLLASCVDAPSGPDRAPASGPFVFAPAFALVGPSGPAVSPAQSSALDDVFDRVDRFRMVVTRASNGAVALDTVIAVTPGADEYDFQVEVEATTDGESFFVTLVALEGDTELFRAESVPVQATVPGVGGGASPPPVVVELTYTGPGATAVSVEVAPGQTVLGPGGTAQLGAKVLDDGGGVIAGAPVSWSSTDEAVAEVGPSGQVTGVGDGVAEVVVTSPTGLSDRAWVYVVGGTLVYVRDGVLEVRAPSGGEAQSRSSGGGASGPAWAGDDLYYSEGGAVLKAGTSTKLLDGLWPSVSPDGGKLAADAGGVLVLANIDGTNPTAGPPGTTPLWSDWSTLVVGGGSIQEIRADGTSRTTLVAGDASLPALSPGGSLAWVSGGKLMVQDRATPVADAEGRPSWSPDGAWIVVPGGGGLLLVAPSGSAPPVALPGLDRASDPAWQGTSVGGGSPPALNLTRLDPDPAIPGQEVSIVGSGFDWIIPANNRLFWPGPDGALSGDILSVTATDLRAVLPRSAVAGQIRVENRQGSAVLEYAPAFGFLEVHAGTPWDTPLSGVGITLVDGSGHEAATGATDGEGDFVSGALPPGDYTLQIGVPTGFALDGAATRSLTIAPAVSLLDLTLTPLVDRVRLTPANPTLGVSEELPLTVEPFDVNGDAIPEVSSVSWASASSRLEVLDGGLSPTLVGRRPSARAGDAGFTVTLDGRSFGFAATVTSVIEGTVATASDEAPAPGIAVVLEQGEAEIARTTTDNTGRYRFPGLLAGTYHVRPEAPEGMSANPTSAAVTLGPSNPRGKADFVLVKGDGEIVGKGEVIVVGDIDYWGSVFLQSNNKQMTRNFVTNGTRSKTVWYRGHYSWLESSLYGVTEYFGGAYDYITGTLEQTLEYVATGATGSLSIPDDAASFWIWMPQAPFDAADVAEINRYVGGGGRVILVGWHVDHPAANQRVQELMTTLGSAGVYQPACFGKKATADVVDDPLMAGVNNIKPDCTSYFIPGAGDEPLVFLDDEPIVMRLRLGPPPSGAPVAPVAAGGATGPGMLPRDPASADRASPSTPFPDPRRIRRR